MTLDAWRRLWFLYAIALTYTFSIVVFYVFARYRFPLVPVLLLSAAGGIAAWRDPAARPRRRWAFAALVRAGVLANLPLASARVDRVAHYVNIGNALLLDPAKRDEAAAFYEKALRDSPGSPAAHFGLGVLLVQKDRPQEAIAHYQTAVAGWPDNADLRLNFALALAAAGDNQRAFDELDAAAGLHPGELHHFFGLARAVPRVLGREGASDDRRNVPVRDRELRLGWLGSASGEDQDPRSRCAPIPHPRPRPSRR